MRSPRTIAVAGGTGFIGAALCARLRAAGYTVVILARGREHSGANTALELRRCDLYDPLDPELLAGCDVLVNLVGIKHERGGLSFERAHESLPVEFASVAERSGVLQMIHISVAGANLPAARAASSPYLATKARGELELEAHTGELALTILRPGVVYGRGDDMLRNLADSIRAAPLFPAPAGGHAAIAAVSIDDVVRAVQLCIERAPAPGQHRSYDIVGPEAPPLRELVARVAAHPVLARRCWIVSAPRALQQLAAALLERGSSDPLITRSQLDLLSRGVLGDPEPARRELGFEASALDDAAISAALADFRPRLPSLRLVPDATAASALAEHSGPTPPGRAAFFALLALAALLLGPLLPASIWWRMAGLELALSVIALSSLRLRWTELWRPTLPALAWGLGAGALMWAGAFLVRDVLMAVSPELWTQTAGIYMWATELPLAHALALLMIIVAGEELVWRGALGVGFTAHMRPELAVLASAGLFTLAHLTTGPPVLAIAAALAGGAWTYLAIRSRSLFASFVAHLAWDITMLWLTPL